MIDTEHLRGVIKRVNDNPSDDWKQILVQCDELTEILDQLESAQKDADRYLWLRSQPNNTDAPRIDVVQWLPEDESANCSKGLRTEVLDAAIDASMDADRASNGGKA